MGLEGSATHENLKLAFARESQTNRRYHWFAQQADVEGYPNAAVLFRALAEGETGHAHGLLEYLSEVGDPISGEPIGDTKENLRSAVTSETHEYTELYPGFAKTAREEGFEEIAEWLDTLARAEQAHARKFDEFLTRLNNT
jgi:rubrerythrin